MLRVAVLVLWGGLARVACALSAQTPAEAERAAALHRTFGNVHEAVGAFFDNLDLAGGAAGQGGLAPWHHALQEMMGKQRSNASRRSRRKSMSTSFSSRCARQAQPSRGG